MWCLLNSTKIAVICMSLRLFKTFFSLYVRLGICIKSSCGCTDRNCECCTSLNDVRIETITGIIGLKRGSGCPVTITGGTEVCRVLLYTRVSTILKVCVRWTLYFNRKLQNLKFWLMQLLQLYQIQYLLYSYKYIEWPFNDLFICQVGHASGEHSHWNGYELDIALNGCVNGHITGRFNYIGLRRDGAPMYQSGNGTYAKESSHWDIVYNWSRN